MIRLFVDDFRPAPKGWVQAKTVTEAVRMIATFSGKIAQVSLDHDIIDSPETFMPVAHYLAIFIPYRNMTSPEPVNINLHSGDPVGVEAMKKLLIASGIPQETITERSCSELYDECR